MSESAATVNPELCKSFSWCKSLAKKTSGNFYFSFRTLPADQLRDMCVLYAFMRVTDDLGDDAEQPTEIRRANLLHWRKDVEAALSGGEASHPALPALCDLVSRRQIPAEYLLAVIEGVEQDLDHDGFGTFVTVFPRDNDPDRCAVLLQQRFAVNPGNRHG